MRALNQELPRSPLEEVSVVAPEEALVAVSGGKWGRCIATGLAAVVLWCRVLGG